MTIHDIEPGDIFRWRDSLYWLRTEDNGTGTASVICIGRRRGDTFYFVPGSHTENFNAYAEIDTLVKAEHHIEA